MDGATATKGVWNLQLTGVPTHGDQFRINDITFRAVSAAALSGQIDEHYYQYAYGANVSAAYSAISATVNKFLSARTSGSTVAAGAGGSRTDITLTAPLTGMNWDMNVAIGTTITFTESTVETTGKPLPEGYVSYVTSGGDTIRVTSPAEATYQNLINPMKQN